MMFLLFASTALATTWLPATTIDHQADAPPVLLEQVAGERHLLRFDPIPESLSPGAMDFE